MFEKKYILLYLDYLNFLIKVQTGRLRKNYLHYTFEQETFKKYQIKMNQKFRQNAKDSVEKVFLNF